MSKTQFTPGLWVPNIFIASLNAVTSSKDGEMVCTGVFSNADTYLIAAAPEMYEMLDNLMNATGPGDAEQLLSEERENIQLLLAKARGTQ